VFEIRDPEKPYFGFRIQGSKRHRIPNPGSGSATLVSYNMKCFKTGSGLNGVTGFEQVKMVPTERRKNDEIPVYLKRSPEWLNLLLTSFLED
jgi:hypothetical protein